MDCQAPYWLSHWTSYKSKPKWHTPYDGENWSVFNTLRQRKNGQHLTDNIFKCIFFNENVSVLIKISLKFVPKGPINNIPALVQIMAWRHPGNKPSSLPMMLVNWLVYVSLGLNELTHWGRVTHICISKLTIIGSDNGSSPGRRQAIIWTNAGIL